MSGADEGTRRVPSDPVAVRMVRGVWWEGTALEPGARIVVPARVAASWVQDGKAEIEAEAPVAPVQAEANVVPIRSREPVRRARR